ncbi:hypothetical protein M23134_06124 [Microscilla marina ATCC 23134]|uniref:Uncharacterized protein n=1 Tax=Microscilla marina ATCC 23134 TaxID=313606 RepID=A1ZSL6_MICM2|nr:hypothetical protein M23134_06124 [Microscilla marina ATCC 23134]
MQSYKRFFYLQEIRKKNLVFSKMFVSGFLLPKLWFLFSTKIQKNP